MTLFDFRDDENLTAASNILQNMRLQIQQVRVNLNFLHAMQILQVTVVAGCSRSSVRKAAYHSWNNFR